MPNNWLKPISQAIGWLIQAIKLEERKEDLIMIDWLFEVHNNGENYYCCCDSFMKNGKECFSHNEIGFSFTFDGDFHIIDGWHIGTEDFDFSDEEDGQEYCLYYINYYHEGLLEKLKNWMEKN